MLTDFVIQFARAGDHVGQLQLVILDAGHGIVGVFQSKRTKLIIASVSVAALLFGVVIMLQVPITWL